MVRPLAKEEISRLKAADKSTKGIGFYHTAEEGYSRNLSELTLHQVMRRLMRLVDTELRKNIIKLESAVDSTLLIPPSEKKLDSFYPDSLNKYPEYKDYYYKKEASKPTHHSHQFQGSLRPADDLDAIFRGGGDSASLYTRNPDAGGSLHSKVSMYAFIYTCVHIFIYSYIHICHI